MQIVVGRQSVVVVGIAVGEVWLAADSVVLHNHCLQVTSLGSRWSHVVEVSTNFVMCP